MAEENTEAFPTEEGTDKKSGGLLFDWQPSPRLVFHLGIFVVVSILIHVFGFYLFQVVYPTSGRLEPEPRRITLLSGSQASENALLREVDDRLVFLRPASAGSDVRVTLGDFSAQFYPSYAARAVEFKMEPPIAAVREEKDRVMEDPLAPRRKGPPVPVLPPVTGVVNALDPLDVDAEDAGARWRVGGKLKGRKVIEGEVFEKGLPILEGPPVIRLSVGVGANGDVQHVLPIAGESHPKIREIVEAVRNGLRFEPGPGTDLEWGWLSIER